MRTRSASQSLANIELFSRLPYDVLEDITFYLNVPDLRALSLSSKHLSSLAARALYADVPLHLSSPETKPTSRPRDTLRRRQFSFLVALSQHPEYSVYVRRLEWEFIDAIDPHSALDLVVSDNLVWETFARCKGVTSILITMSNGHHTKPPSASLFPYLRHARISGIYPEMSLDRLLHSSTRLQSLSIAPSTYEHVHSSRQWPSSCSSSLSPYLYRSIRVNAFKALRSFAFEASLVDDGIAAPSSLVSFVKHVIPHLEDLTIRFTTEMPEEKELVEMWDVIEVLELSQCLATLRLTGKISADVLKAIQVKAAAQFSKIKIAVDTLELL